MSKERTEIPDYLRTELDACGLPWRAEAGARHIKVFLCERLIQVVSRGQPRKTGGDRSHLNARAQVRRAIREARQHAQS